MAREKNEKRLHAIKIIVAVLGISLVLTGVIYFFFKQFFSEGSDGLGALKRLADDHPAIGAAVIITASVIQVVIAFIPGELLEQAAGFIAGPWLGALYCLIGNMTGSVIAILIARRFGRSLVYAIYPKEKIDELSFLKDKGKRNILTFFLFFIPGTPKDLLTYVLGLTDMGIPTYLFLTTFARIPSIVMSTVSGGWIADLAGSGGKILHIVIWNAAAVAICGIGYLIYYFITKTHSGGKKSPEDKDDPNDTEHKES